MGRFQHIKKNALHPHQSLHWKNPPDHNGEFVAKMEDVIDIYQRPYDSDFPVVCFDESSKQLVGEVRAPIPMTENHPMLQDDEYVRNGVAEILLGVEPLA